MDNSNSQITYHDNLSSSSWLQTLDCTKRRLLVFLFTSFFSLLVYLFTLVPEVNWGDGAELSLQVYQLGVTHPPGYPVYTLLGKAVNLIVTNPAAATNLLSALCTALTIGLMSLFILDLTNHIFASSIVPLIFAFTPQVWSMAVTTEVYNVNLLFLGLTLYLFHLWYKDSSMSALFLSSILFGVSLGTYLANLLLLPAFIFLLYRSKHKSYHKILLFISVSAILGISVLSFTYFRAGIIPPIGTRYIPGSLTDTIRYFTGHQYGTLSIQDLSFYLMRPIEHAARFGQNFLWIGILLGLYGIFIQRQMNRDLCLFFLLIMSINFVYFTYYRTFDYYTMITPSYFIFSLWIAYSFTGKKKLRPAVLTVSIIVCIGLLIMQVPERIERTHKYPVTNFVLSSFKQIPKNAVVICGWNKFTPLLYFQKTHNLRDDITLIERVKTTRYYEHGKVDSYLTFIDSHISLRPLIIDHVESIIQKRFNVTTIDNNWSQINLLK